MGQVKLTSFIQDHYESNDLDHLYWVGTMQAYIDKLAQDPRITRNAFQRMYDMVMSYGFENYVEYGKEITRYRFFDDPHENGRNAVYGIDVHLMKLMNFLKAASVGYGAEKRILLLHGPVGSAKSSIASLLKRGLERYSRTDEGQLYSFEWFDETKSEILGGEKVFPSPMQEDPIKLIPLEVREKFLHEINRGQEQSLRVKIKGEVCPSDRYILSAYLEKYKGNWEKVMANHVRVYRLLLSEKDRIGIGTFQPKDEKNQDSTELSGDLNYRKIALYGSDSDPRAFNFDGEFNVANRGMIEFIEMLKLDVAFLYDLLGASQEQSIKPKKFAQTDIDEVILGHTNEPEFKKLQNNEFMEALRDRTVKIDIPYITRLDKEMLIYKKDFNSEKIPHMHLSPTLLKVASMWSVLTRLEEPQKSDLTLLQKLKLYNGKNVFNYTEDNVKELRKQAIREGFSGISPRYIQDKISSALVKNGSKGCLDPLMLLHELESGLKHHSLINNAQKIEVYRELLVLVREEYEDLVKDDVQKVIVLDEDRIQALYANYIDHIKNFVQGESSASAEQFMRSVEEKVDVMETGKADFRREIVSYIDQLVREGKKFDYRMKERLQRGLELKLFEDQRDSLKLTTLVSKDLDSETKARINLIKSRLIKEQGYCEVCTHSALSFVASVYSKESTAE